VACRLNLIPVNAYMLSQVVRLGVERQPRWQVVVGFDLRLESGDLLLSYGNSIDPAMKRRGGCSRSAIRLSGLGELGRIAGLLTILGLIPCTLGGVALGVVHDGQLGVGRRLLSEKLGAEETGVDDSGVDAEWRDLGL
jgi:hypothetical protein